LIASQRGEPKSNPSAENDAWNANDFGRIKRMPDVKALHVLVLCILNSASKHIEVSELL
jgi:hypothetical protein